MMPILEFQVHSQCVHLRDDSAPYLKHGLVEDPANKGRLAGERKRAS